MVAADHSYAGKDKQDSPPNREAQQAGKVALGVATDSTLEQQLTQARTNRSQAETARNRIVTEIMEAARDLYQKLAEEGEGIVGKAKQLEADAELRSLEAQRELEHSNTIRSEAEAYRQEMIARAQKQAQEIVQQAQVIKAEAVTFKEKLLAQVSQQAQQELDQAQAQRFTADAYREKVIAQAQAQAQEILDQARIASEQEGAEIVQKFTIEGEKLLAQAKLIKSAAQEQLDALRLYAEVANLETESKDVLERARADYNQGQSLMDLGPSDQVPSAEHTSGPAVFDELKQLEILFNSINSSEADELPLEDAVGEEVSHQPDLESYDEQERLQTLTDGPGPSREASVLADNDLILGIEIGEHSKAYPLQVVTEARVINDSLNELPLLITFGPPSELGIVFKREVNGRVLSFEPTTETDNGLMLMKDRETGTTWEALTGRAIRGELAYGELEHVNSEYSFWFAWSEVHPNSEIYAPQESVNPANAPD